MNGPPGRSRTQARPAGTCRSGPERDRLITATHAILANCGVAMGPRRVHRLVQTFQERVERNGFQFFDFLANTVQLDEARRRQALADPEVQRAIAYADPTGEEAVRNVQRERGW
jgi:hypothetical protein